MSQNIETDVVPEGKVDQERLADQLRSAVDYLYANHILVSVNKWDVRLTFADAKTSTVVRPLAGIVMTHLKAKKLLVALRDSIATLEESIGEIKDMPELPSRPFRHADEDEPSDD